MTTAKGQKKAFPPMRTPFIQTYGREIEILNNETRRREKAHGSNKANAWYRSRRSVLDCLRLHFDGRDEQIHGFAAHARVAAFTGFAESTVRTAIDDLLAIGLVERVERFGFPDGQGGVTLDPNGGRLPNGYRFPIREATSAEAWSMQPPIPEGASSSGGVPGEGQQGGVPGEGRQRSDEEEVDETNQPPSVSGSSGTAHDVTGGDWSGSWTSLPLSSPAWQQRPIDQLPGGPLDGGGLASLPSEREPPDQTPDPEALDRGSQGDEATQAVRSVLNPLNVTPGSEAERLAIAFAAQNGDEGLSGLVVDVGTARSPAGALTARLRRWDQDGQPKVEASPKKPTTTGGGQPDYGTGITPTHDICRSRADDPDRCFHCYVYETLTCSCSSPEPVTDENRADADRQRADTQERAKRNLEKGSGSSRRQPGPAPMTREETEAAKQAQIEALRQRFGS